MKESCDLVSEACKLFFIDITGKKFQEISDMITEKVINSRDILLVKKYQDILNWDILSARFPFSESNLEFFSEKLNWKELSYKEGLLSERIMDKYQKKLDWDGITSFQKLSSDFIYTHLHQVNFDRLFQDQIISSELLSNIIILKSPEKLDWKSISRNVILTYEQLRKYKDYLDWPFVFLYQPIISNDEVFSEFRNLVWNDSRFYKHNPFCNYKREMKGRVNKDWFICHSIIGDWFNVKDSYCISYRDVGRVYVFRTRVFYKDLLSTVTFNNCDILKKINIETDNTYKR